jgi:hypothetical protein
MLGSGESSQLKTRLADCRPRRAVLSVEAGSRRARSRPSLVVLAARARRTAATSARSPAPGTAARAYLERSSAEPILAMAAASAGLRPTVSVIRVAIARGDSLGNHSIP